jgi:acetolactate synthase I/II/III large subunit
VRKLVEAGPTTIFGYSAESTLPLYAATQVAPDLRHVMAPSERCAGYMADGYARLAGRSGLRDAPGGVGTPWLMRARHEAWASAMPMIAITTSSRAGGRGRWPTADWCVTGAETSLDFEMFRSRRQAAA